MILAPFVRLRCGLLAVLLAVPLGAAAQSPTSPPAAGPQGLKTIGIPSRYKATQSLIVLNARSARLDRQTLVLEGTLPSAILFADRPVRRAGHILTREVVDLWATGSFAKDPPNATVSAFRADGSAVRDAVVVLKRPRLEGEKLTFDVAVLEGDLGTADGPASIFIDTIWFGVGSGGVTYLGQNRTTGGTTPTIGDSSFTGWSNPSPNGPPRQPPPDYGLTAPPDMNAAPYRAPCGAPPMLPCY